MEILHITRKGGMMNTLERFYIYNKTKLDNRIKDKFTIKSKVIFDIIIQRNISKGHSPLYLPLRCSVISCNAIRTHVYAEPLINCKNCK